MDSFLGKKHSNTTTNVEGQQQHGGQQHQQHQPSTTELLSDAKLVAGAAQSAMKKDTSSVDKTRVADAAGNLLDAAEKYGKLEEKGMGKYVDKAEEYLHNYNKSSQSPGAAAGHTPATGEGHAQQHHSGEKKEGHSESGGGMGDYVKMAQGFMK